MIITYSKLNQYYRNISYSNSIFLFQGILGNLATAQGMRATTVSSSRPIRASKPGHPMLSHNPYTPGVLKCLMRW